MLRLVLALCIVAVVLGAVLGAGASLGVTSSHLVAFKIPVDLEIPDPPLPLP